MWSMRLLALALAAFAFSPLTDAHSTFEAQELEIHALNDEGTDLMESYGGYDINELFVGAANHPELGVGVEGDGVYFRIEAYGHPAETTSAQPWALTVKFTGPAGPIARTVFTSDGIEFKSDFDALAYEVEAPELHIQRAFILNCKSGLTPGAEIKDLIVESRYGNDLRDVAPGGIYVPGTNGAATYPDPTQIDGKGRLVETVAAPSVSSYFGNVTGHAEGGAYEFTLHNPLKQGGQHWSLGHLRVAGWGLFNVTGNGPVAKASNATFRFDVRHDLDAPAAQFDLLSDVGGRLPLVLQPDGTLQIGSASIVPAKLEAKTSPAVGALVVIGLVSMAALRRRTMG